MKRRLMTAISAGALVAVMLPGASTLAQDASWTVITDGLDAPRGMDFGPDGTLYVAVGGSGGDECMEAPGPEGDEMVQVCVGLTGAVAAIDVATGERTDVVSGLPSTHIETDGVIGPPDVAVDNDGGIYFLTGDGAVPDPAERPEGDLGAIVWKVGDDGTPQQLVDLMAFEAEANPDGGLLDSNPNGISIAPDGGLLIADAGANAFVIVPTDGTPFVRAVFADTMVEAPAMPEGEGVEAEAGAEPPMMPMQQVPTSIALGPDPSEAAYVTFLRGFPFAPGSAWVARVAPNEDPTAYAEGFTNVIDAAFASDGTLYVLEMFTNGMLSGDPTGALWSVPAGGGEATLVASEGLMTPGGIAISADDEIYISNGSVQPGSGAIVRLDQ
jgi:sugar lactone lactonase YvrE